jgi:hypothetical protein
MKLALTLSALIALASATALASLTMPRAAQCKSTLEGPVVKVTFSKISFDSDTLRSADQNYDQGYSGSSDDCIANLKQPVMMNVADQLFVNTSSSISVKAENCRRSSDANFLQAEFKSQDVPSYRATMRLWSSGLLTIDSGSQHQKYDCTVTDAY